MAMYLYYVSTNAFKIGIPTRILISPSAFLIRKVEVVLPIVDMVNHRELKLHAVSDYKKRPYKKQH